MTTETVAIETVHEAQRNIRIHPEEQIRELARSITMFGQIRPVVVDEDGMILAGHALVKALVLLGRKTVDVLRISGLTYQQKIKLTIADNRIYDLGSTSGTDLIELLHELDNDFDVPGFQLDLLQMLTANQEQIDTSVLSYGTMSPTDKAQIQGKSSTVQTSGNETKTIICPTCGKSIEL